MVQTGAGVSRFHLSCECKMQMTPSGDSFMTAVDSQRYSQDRNPVTPIRRPNLLSDSLHIGSIIQRAHQSYREMASAVIEGEISKLCVCAYVRQTQRQGGDALIFPTLLFFMLCLPFLPLNLPILSSTCTLALPTFILFIILFSQVHHLFTYHIAGNPWLFFHLNSSSCSPYMG